jgi:hypothetical protein
MKTIISLKIKAVPTRLQGVTTQNNALYNFIAMKMSNYLPAMKEI